MSIASEISRLQTAKADLKTAIEGKGVTVPSNTKLDGYADLVDSIETGDDWVYVNCNTLSDTTNPGAKAGSRFYVQFTNSSNLIVEFMPPYETSVNPTPTWTSNKLISTELQPPTDYLIRYRIKPGVNMVVGDVGTLTITNSSGTVTYTFKLVKTFSNTAVLNTQSVDDGADIEKLNVSGGDAPYIVNPLNGADLGSNLSSGIITHQYQVSGANIVSSSLSYTPYHRWDNYAGLWNSDSKTNPYLAELYGQGIEVSITNQGLISYNYNRSQSDVNDYEWLNRNIINVTLILDNGCALTDYFRGWTYFSCIIKDTNITLANKTNKKIQDITYDDELFVWNFDEGKYDSAKPLWIKKAQTTTWYYRLTFSDGTVLNVTGDYPKAHSLYSVDDGKFIHANELVGKKVYTLNGIQTLEKCEEIHEEVEFYNIITDYHMNLFAEGILTSTSLNNLYPIEKMTFIKEDREPVFDTSIFKDKWIKGLRLNEQPNDVTNYVNNVIRLAIDGNGFDNF